MGIKIGNMNKYNFNYGNKLYDSQEHAFKNLHSISLDEINLLQNNLYIRLAKYLAPSNLVIRHYCLLDLINKKCNHVKQIYKQFQILTYNSPCYAEGYSYWLCVRPFYKKWIDVFKPHFYVDPYLIEYSFKSGCYRKYNEYYPIPIGDIRNIPLEEQTTFLDVHSQNFGTIQSYPIGYNLHTNEKSFEYEVINNELYYKDKNGKNILFKYYTNYPYNTFLKELRALIKRTFILISVSISTLINPLKKT